MKTATSYTIRSEEQRKEQLRSFLANQDTIYTKIFLATFIATPLGTMLAISNQEALYFLDFIGHPRLEQKITKLQKRTLANIEERSIPLLVSLAKELNAYFTQNFQKFTTPFVLIGSSFQKATWQSLLTIPYGNTISYKALAHSIEKPSAHRAVANANGANNLAVIIPCHRVIASNGDLGGYGSGTDRKQTLLNHEQGVCQLQTPFKGSL